MNKPIFLVIASLFYACGPSDDANTPLDDNSNFEITIDVNSSASIDEPISIVVTGNEPLKSVQVFLGTLESGSVAFDDHVNSTRLNYSFDTVGERTFRIKATNLNGVVRERTISVSITRGNAIKITSVQILSFHDINQTWDPAFSDTNPNRLADVKFAFEKAKINIFNNNFSNFVWFISTVKENQDDLTWNLASENLYMDPNLSLRFSAGDDDGNGIGQDLMLGPPFSREINMSQYISTRPNNIMLSVPEIDLEVLLTVEWPN